MFMDEQGQGYLVTEFIRTADQDVLIIQGLSINKVSADVISQKIAGQKEF